MTYSSKVQLKFGNDSQLAVDFFCYLKINFPSELNIPAYNAKVYVAALPPDTLILSYTCMRLSGLGHALFPALSSFEQVKTIKLSPDDHEEPYGDLIDHHLPDMGDDLPVDDSNEVEYEFPNLTHCEGTEWHQPFQQLIWEFRTKTKSSPIFRHSG